MVHLGYARILAIDRFEDAWRRGQMNRFWKRLTGKQKMLLPFASIHSGLLHPSGFNQGIQEIPIKKIQGSLAQAPEFDRDFRPLHKNQRQRWANVWVLHMQKGWKPILVHKIDGIYFVEDGHHRISVARNLGLETIEASVIAYPGSIALNPNDSLEDILVSLEAAFPA
jgi:hypothetical protein